MQSPLNRRGWLILSLLCMIGALNVWGVLTDVGWPEMCWVHGLPWCPPFIHFLVRIPGSASREFALSWRNFEPVIKSLIGSLINSRRKSGVRTCRQQPWPLRRALGLICHLEGTRCKKSEGSLQHFCQGDAAPISAWKRK